MERWVQFLVVGVLATFIDGALGMGFGPTSSSILLGTGLSPAGISTTVNLAKVATGLTAAVAHWRFGNIDRPLVVRLDGNNAELGRQILADAALPGVQQVDTMDDAAKRAAQLAAGV